MSQQALSGESRKQLFIDSRLKVTHEQGRILEFLDREMNVVKAFAKIMLGSAYEADIDALKVDIKITPFAITDEKDEITNLMTANGGEPIMSQRESIERFGHSDDVDKTLAEIAEQKKADVFEPYAYLSRVPNTHCDKVSELIEKGVNLISLHRGEMPTTHL